MMKEASVCEYCGYTPVLVLVEPKGKGRTRFVVRCEECGRATFEYDKPTEAINAWNQKMKVAKGLDEYTKQIMILLGKGAI